MATEQDVQPFVFPEKEPQSEHYELMVLISGNASDEDAVKTFAEVKDLLTSFQGEITSENVMGRQPLAYSVDKSRQANYFVVEFDMLRNQLAALQEKLRIRKDVTRYLIVKKRKMTAEEVAAQEAFRAKREEYAKKRMLENAAKNAERAERRAGRQTLDKRTAVVQDEGKEA